MPAGARRAAPRGRGAVGRKRVERLMRRAGLQGAYRRRRRGCTVRIRSSRRRRIWSTAGSSPTGRTRVGHRHQPAPHPERLVVPGGRAGPVRRRDAGWPITVFRCGHAVVGIPPPQPRAGRSRGQRHDQRVRASSASAAAETAVTATAPGRRARPRFRADPGVRARR
ncbi:IS3 family transposase [Micromonospora chersina]|uniref:IS3 family transposase n=1 Tax=Micromonospora chersina TaxID=47854 RepID=UPI0033F4867B